MGAPLCIVGKHTLRPLVFWAVPPAPCRRASTPIHSPSDCIVRACMYAYVRAREGRGQITVAYPVDAQKAPQASD